MIPICRIRSATGRPSSACLRTGTICSVEYLQRAIGVPGIELGDSKRATPITNIRNLNSSWWKNFNGPYLREPEYRCFVRFYRFAKWDKASKGNAWLTMAKRRENLQIYYPCATGMIRKWPLDSNAEPGPPKPSTSLQIKKSRLAHHPCCVKTFIRNLAALGRCYFLSWPRELEDARLPPAHRPALDFALRLDVLLDRLIESPRLRAFCTVYTACEDLVGLQITRNRSSHRHNCPLSDVSSRPKSSHCPDPSMARNHDRSDNQVEGRLRPIMAAST